MGQGSRLVDEVFSCEEARDEVDGGWGGTKVVG